MKLTNEVADSEIRKILLMKLKKFIIILFGNLFYFHSIILFLIGIFNFYENES